MGKRIRLAGMSMKKGALFALLVAGLSTIGCGQIDVDSVGFDKSKPIEVPEQLVIQNGAMGTAIGPIAPNLEKWGHDQSAPFSWPGRAVQIAQTNPSIPEDQLVYEILLKNETELHKVHVWVEPATGHGRVPYSRVQSMVWLYNGGFQEFELAGATPTLGDSVANYEQRYLLTTELIEPIAAKSDTRIFVYVFGEWGEGSIMGLTVDTPEIVYSDLTN
jgi:hypothetical protein